MNLESMATSQPRKQRARQHARARERQQWLRVIGFTAIVLVVLVAAGIYLAPMFSFRPSGVTTLAGNGKIVNIQAAMDGFDIKEIRAKVGETLVVNLASLDNEHHTDGGGRHQFAIQELGVDLIAQPLSSNTATFTVTQPGVYTYYCDICCGGKANPTMNGRLVVES